MLEDVYNKKGFKLYPVYGRRRIGKTTLIKEFLSKHDGIYYLCSTIGTPKNLEYFSRKLSEKLEMPQFKVESFRDLFENLIKVGFTKGLIVIDEFPYLVQHDKTILGEFQFIIDEILNDTDICLILCGSSVGMMEDHVLAQKSPLFGRRTGQLKVGPIGQGEMTQFLRGYSFSDVVIVQSMAGGVPRYLEEFSEHKKVDKTLEKSYFSPDGYLFREAQILLRDELREPDTYMNILESMARGNTRVTTIANASYLQAKDLSKYMNILMRLGIVKKYHPITEKKGRSKKSIYKIEDDYFLFWFKFVFPYRGEIEMNDSKTPMTNFNSFKSEFLGKYLEKFVMEFLRGRGDLNRVGTWWQGEEEIDIVGIDQEKKKILFVEVKMRNKMANAEIAQDLIRKSYLVKGYERYKHEYLVVSWSGFTKSATEVMKELNVTGWDKNDLEKMVLNK